MKKILILLTLVFLLTACGNADIPITGEPDMQATNQAWAEERMQTSEAEMLETLYAALKDVQTATPYPTYTPYPTPIPTDTPTPTLAYDSCKATGGTWIRTTAKARLYTPRWNKDETGLKVLNGKLIIILVSVKDHTGINPGVTICAFERRQTDKGAAWGFWYQRPLGYLGDTYGYYLLASQVERIVVE